MSRPSLPADIDELIAQVTPYISSSASPVDIIRIALFRMKEQFILGNNALTLDNPQHPYYSKTTKLEEQKIIESRADINNTQSGNAKEIINWLNS